MANKTQWKVAKVQLPVTGFSDWKKETLCRMNGEEFQVRVQTTVPKPYFVSPEEYIKEITDYTAGVLEARLDFQEGNDEYSSDIELTGWRVPTEAELAVLKENVVDSVEWATSTF